MKSAQITWEGWCTPCWFVLIDSCTNKSVIFSQSKSLKTFSEITQKLRCVQTLPLSISGLFLRRTDIWRFVSFSILWYWNYSSSSTGCKYFKVKYHNCTNIHKCQLTKSLASSSLKKTSRPATLLVPVSLKDGRITSNFKSAGARNDLFHLSSFDQNPLPNMKSLYVGQWIVISILGQLWANLKMFGYLWKKARVNIVFFLVRVLQRNCLVSLAGRFFYALAFVSLSARGFREVKSSKGLCMKNQQLNRTGGMTDMSSTQQHATCSYVQRGPLPRGLLSAGLSCYNVPVQTNVPRVHHSVLPIKPSCCQSNENTWPADREIDRARRKWKAIKVEEGSTLTSVG